VKFFLDHDVPAAVKNALERHAHNVIQLRETLASDSPDDRVFFAAQENECVMITCNRNDFLQLAAGQSHRGLIILIRRRTPQAECTNLLRLIARAGETGLTGNVNFA
jgi:predicted nuclease of predicted toxin-antitoxin system